MCLCMGFTYLVNKVLKFAAEGSNWCAGEADLAIELRLS